MSRFWMSARSAELKMGSDQYRSPQKINCVLCQKSDEDEITGPLSSKENISAHQNCLVSSRRVIGGVSSMYISVSCVYLIVSSVVCISDLLQELAHLWRSVWIRCERCEEWDEERKKTRACITSDTHTKHTSAASWNSSFETLHITVSVHKTLDQQIGIA